MMTTAYVIEKRVREDWSTQARSQFSESDLTWQIVDRAGVPSRMAYLYSVDAINDIPTRNLDDWWEFRVRDLNGEVIATYPGKPIPPDYISWDHLRRAPLDVEDISIDALKELQKRYYEESDVIREMAAIIACEMGNRLSVDYGPKFVYAPDDPDGNKYHGKRKGLSIYVDDYGHYMTIHVDGKLVCSTHPTEQLFVPGEWVKRIDAIYKEAYQLMIARRQQKAEDMRRVLARRFK